MVKGPVVQGVGMRSCPGQPAGDRPLAMAEDAHGRSNIDPFGQGAEHFGDPRGRSLQAIEGRMAASTEAAAAGLAAEILDAVPAVMAVGDQGVDGSIGDAGIKTGGIAG